jgi:hypothetical protein
MFKWSVSVNGQSFNDTYGIPMSVRKVFEAVPDGEGSVFEDLTPIIVTLESNEKSISYRKNW